MSLSKYTSQNDLLLQNLEKFYKNTDHLKTMIHIINGESKISLRIVDWFVTNYAKKHFIVYNIQTTMGETNRFKVYNDYKLKLKSYSKRRFDPFCRWDRIQFPYDEKSYVETTIGQLNFFKWSIENNILNYIETHYQEIEDDMNERNSNAKKSQNDEKVTKNVNEKTTVFKTRKKREELSISATKCIKKESVKIVVTFN